MAVNAVEYELKIRKLLEKFLEPNFHINNDVYLNTLLSHLSGKDNKDLGKGLLNLPIFTEWLINATINWETNSEHPTKSIGTFILNLTALLSQDEQKFLVLKENNIYERLIILLQLKQDECNPSLKLGFIKLLHSFLEHKRGVDYITSTNYWLDALSFCLSNQTVYIIKEGNNFIYALLEKNADNHVFCDAVIKEIISTLVDNRLVNATPFPEVKEELYQKVLTPCLQLINYIFLTYFDSVNYLSRDYRIPILFIRENNLEQLIWNLMLIVHDDELIIELEKVIVAVTFLNLNLNCTEDVYPLSLLRETGKVIFNIIGQHMSRKDITGCMKYCYWVHYFWQYINPRCPILDPNDEHPLLLENQLIVLQIMPMFAISMRFCNITFSLENDDFRDNYITKLFKIMHEHTIRLVYHWRSVILDHEDVFENALFGLNYLMKSRKYFKRDTKAIIFQTFIYALKDISTAVHTNPEVTETFVKDSTYLLSLVDAVTTFILDYDFTWRDIVETICVMSCCLDILSFRGWSTRLNVKYLKLLNLSIAKFMAPNLVLLVDNDSTMENLGPLLMTKLQDISWEIRDSALEVVHTIAEISHKKFPAFQRILLQSGFLPLVVGMSSSDTESYVRASAIKCLQEMIKVSAFWYPELEQDELPQKMLCILKNETEALVRSEAAKLICDIFFYQNFPEEMMPEVYETMSYAATSDLHWEVKVSALNFWECLIKCHLQNQGMIDGTFPSVTFSKEHKKIVTLTCSEIHIRLNKALVQLSNCGCLGVLMAAALDDCDLEVSKAAIGKLKILTDLFTKYKFKTVASSSCTPSSPTANSVIHHESQKSNNIIEDIVNSKDINLVSNIYDSQDVFLPNNKQKYLKIVSPETFLNFVQKDFNLFINERSSWLNNIDNLNSLLDDMLKTYDDDINTMDCY